MKKVKISVLALVFLFLAISVFAAQINSSNYKQMVIISVGGENLSSSSYKMNIAAGIINWVINSSNYINRLGFFHTLLLANDQPCTSANQCEGGFCCDSLCKSSACPSKPSPTPSGGGGGGGSGGGGGVFVNITNITKVKEQKVKDFSIEPSSIKEQLVLGTAKTKAIRIRNIGNTALSFDLNVLAVKDFIFLSDTSFSLEAGQEKIVELNIIGKKLGSYIGEIEVRGDGIKKLINVIIEVESKEVLFDVKLDIPSAYKELRAGTDLKAQITLLNIGPPRIVDVTTTYIIKDKHGKVIYEASETFAVENQKSFVKSFKIPKKLTPDEYLAIVEARYSNSFAVSSELFRVVPEYKTIIDKLTMSNTFLIFIWVVFVGFMLLFIYLFVPKIKISKKRK